MDGQTTIDPCAICGEPAEREVEIRPGADPTYDKLGRPVVKLATKAWLCGPHLKAHDSDWQDRQAKRRAWQRSKLKTAQARSTLFDASEGIPSVYGKDAA